MGGGIAGPEGVGIVMRVADVVGEARLYLAPDGELAGFARYFVHLRERGAPYMRNGSVATLCDVVNHYSELNGGRLHAEGERILKPLRLTAGEKNDAGSISRVVDQVGREAAAIERPARCSATP